MKLYTEEQVKEAFKMGHDHGTNWIHPNLHHSMKKLTPIEILSNEEIIGVFMNWFLKHYSTATIDGMFGYVNSVEQEVTIREILDHYFDKEQILNQNK